MASQEDEEFDEEEMAILRAEEYEMQLFGFHSRTAYAASKKTTFI